MVTEMLLVSDIFKVNDIVLLEYIQVQKSFIE